MRSRIPVFALLVCFALGIGARVRAQQPALSASPLGVLDARQFAGADIGAKIISAFSSCTANCTVRVPAGAYRYASTLKLPNPPAGKSYELQLDPGATLTYAGAGDAILFPLLGGGKIGIDGGTLEGTAAAANGVHLQPANGIFLNHLTITNFRNGNGVFSDGANTVDMIGNFINGNRIGVFLTSRPNYASNAFHIIGGEITGNLEWGIRSANSNSPATTNQNNLIDGVDLENNGRGPGCNATNHLCGAVFLGWDSGTQVKHSYFEGSPVPVFIGENPAILGIGEGGREQGVSVVGNYFTSTPVSPHLIQLEGLVFDTVIEDNTINGTGSDCFVNIQPFSGKYEQRTYLGPNALSDVYTPSGVKQTLCFGGAPLTTNLNDSSYWYGVSAPGGLRPMEGGLNTGGNFQVGGVLGLAANTRSLERLGSGQSVIAGEFPGGGHLFFGASDPKGACGNAGPNDIQLWLAPTGVSDCENGHWRKLQSAPE